jgi:hypothetical protein
MNFTRHENLQSILFEDGHVFIRDLHVCYLFCKIKHFYFDAKADCIGDVNIAMSRVIFSAQ